MISHNFIFKKTFFLLIFFILSGCNSIKQSQIINNELKFYFKGQTNLHIKNNKRKILKKFIEFSNDENQARQKVKKKCIKYIKINNLDNVKCRYMGTKFTEKVLTSLN